MTAIAEKTVSQVLNEAVDHIERFGWTQGVYYAPLSPRRELNNIGTCEMCMVGAIRYAATSNPTDPRGTGGAIDAVLRHLRLDNIGDAFGWNDEPNRTREDVVAALRGAAKAMSS